MKITKKEKILQDVTTDIICDSCGKSCNTDMGFEYMHLSSDWGFFSGKDMQKWEAHLCEDCVDKKLDFIKFNKTNYFTNNKIKSEV